MDDHMRIDKFTFSVSTIFASFSTMIVAACFIAWSIFTLGPLGLWTPTNPLYAVLVACEVVPSVAFFLGFGLLVKGEGSPA